MILYFIILLVILAGAGCWFLLRKKPLLRVRLRPSGERKPARTPPAVQPSKQMPAFIEEMRRRDQSMKAEIPDTNKSEFDLQEIRRKEKEIMGDPRSSAPKPRPIIEPRKMANQAYGSKEQKKEEDDRIERP